MSLFCFFEVHFPSWVDAHTEHKIGSDFSHTCVRPVPPPPVSRHAFPSSEIIGIIFHLCISLLNHFDFISSIYFSHLGSFSAFTHLKNIKTCTLMHKHCAYLWFNPVHKKFLGLPFCAHCRGDLENASVGLSFVTNFPFKCNIPIKGATKRIAQWIKKKPSWLWLTTMKIRK